MLDNFALLYLAVALLVFLCWAGFGGALVYRFVKFKAQPGKHDRASLVGLALQLIGIALVWFVHRPYLTPLWRLGNLLTVTFAALAVVVAVASAWLGMAAAHRLGEQWSLTARVRQGHKLVTEGPYRLTRHPLYTALLGMILATGLAISYWFVLLAALGIYTAGTLIRIRSEEQLLRAEFGDAYEEFARRVPALLPRLF